MKKLFTKFDVRWGYNNVCIKKGDEWKAAFITNEGLYKLTVMFFSMTNSPATFQAMMNAIFKDEIQEGWLTVYMDDMLIATPDDPVFHKKCVHKSLDKLEKHDLYLKPEKCMFMQKRIEFLGVVLSPASRVVNHDSVVWLRTGVSSGNRPMFRTKNAENTARVLEGPCVDRVPRGEPLWSGMGESGDLGDCPADKISARSDQGPEIRRICQLDHRDCCVPLFMDCFLMPSYCTPALGICLICSISS